MTKVRRSALDLAGQGVSRSRPDARQAQRAFKMFYPYVNLAVDLSFLSCDLAYLFEQTSAYRPWHRWLGLQVQRHGPENLPVVSVQYLPFLLWVSEICLLTL
jgi:hypothetical protein